MEQFTQLFYNITTKKVIGVIPHSSEIVINFNGYDSEGNTKAMNLGPCSIIYPILVENGYDVSILEEYMIENNIPIPE